MARKPRKGDRLVYTGKYAHEMPEVFGDDVDPVTPYPPGKVVGFRDYGTTVTVLLDPPILIDGKPCYDDLFADWPIDETAPDWCSPGMPHNPQGCDCGEGG